MKHLKFVDLRKRIGTQEEFAKLINSSKYCVSKWENGGNLPKTKELRGIAKVLGVTIDELIQSFEK